MRRLDVVHSNEAVVHNLPAVALASCLLISGLPGKYQLPQAGIFNVGSREGSINFGQFPPTLPFKMALCDAFRLGI